MDPLLISELQLRNTVSLFDQTYLKTVFGTIIGKKRPPRALSRDHATCAKRRA